MPLWKKPFIAASAPQYLARNIGPPIVSESNRKPKKHGDGQPYIVSSRNPNGACALATLGRVTVEDGYTAPRVRVELNVGKNTGHIAVFGYYRSLTLQFDESLEGKQIYAKDLLADNFTDITEMLSGEHTHCVALPGELIERLGLAAAAPGEQSEPGLVLRIGEVKDFEAFENSPNLPVCHPRSKFRRLFGDRLQTSPRTPPLYHLSCALLSLIGSVRTAQVELVRFWRKRKRR
jgi:hypothetical protein